MKPLSKQLSEVKARVGVVALAAGFRDASEKALGGKLFLRWQRNLGWKVDRIEMV